MTRIDKLIFYNQSQTKAHGVSSLACIRYDIRCTHLHPGVCSL